MKRVIAMLFAALANQCCPAQDTADLILFNGKVITADRNSTIRSAVVVRDGKVLAVGDDRIAAQYTAPVRIDLKGRALLPGFNDNHLHPTSQSPRAIDADQARSIAQLQQMLRDKARQLGPGEWITGYGWAEANLAEQRNPLRSDLDAACPRNPVVLVRAGGHSAVGNSLALNLAKIDRSTSAPLRGVIEHDAKGEPNGLIRERVDLYSSLVPQDSFQTLRPSYVAGLKRLTTLGLTSITVAAASIGDEVEEIRRPEQPYVALTFKQLRNIYDQYGESLPRATVGISYPGPKALAAYPHRTGYGDDRLKLGAIGEMPAVDGGFTGPTAWTSQDYHGQPGFRGQPFFDEPDLQALADDVAKNGWQLGLHAIGDAAIDMAVRVYAKALEKFPGQDPRWYLAHFTMRPKVETQDLMARIGIIGAAQPNFLYTLENRYFQTLDGERLEHINPVAGPLKRGVILSFGSDNLPIDPRVGLYAAVTRKGLSGARVFGPDEAIPVQEAIRLYTAGTAFMTHDDAKKGTIEPGKFADLIVLDRDPLTVPAEQLLTMQVDMTFIGGKRVYSRRQ